MKWFRYGMALLVVAGVVLVGLANRDITQIYGGLTERVDRDDGVSTSKPLAITKINVLSPDASRFVADRTVLIEHGVIVAVQPDGVVDERFEILDGTGQYLIPGLTDTHVHLFKSPNDLLLYLANGVTHIRELIGEPDHLAWRDSTRSGSLGPDMFIASARIGSFSGLEGFFMEWSQGYLNIDTAEKAITEVRRLHAEGYDAVKIYSQINQETYDAVVREAKALDMRVVGHVPWSITLDEAYPHQESIAHLEELMNALNREFNGFGASTADQFLRYVDSRGDDVAKQLAQHDIAVSTTLWLVESFVRQKFDLETVLREVALEYQNPGISEWTPRVPQGGLGWLPGVNRYQVLDDASPERLASRRVYWETYAEACRKLLRYLVKHEVRIMTGTDANLPPAVPGFSLHDEFESLVNAGMTPAHVLKAATVEPAKWLNNNAGVLEAGRKAHLVLLDANPLEDIRHTRAINAVVVGGQLLNRTTLDGLLASVRQANNASRRRDITPFMQPTLPSVDAE